MSWPKTLKIYTDGASRGNPGLSSIGVSFVTLEGEEVGFLSEQIPDSTNNVAEYTALIFALEKAQEQQVDNIWVCTDSEFMVKQLKGEYKVKSENIKDLYLKAYQLLRSFTKVKLEHVPREKNKRADELANMALDALSKTVNKKKSKNSLFDDEF